MKHKYVSFVHFLMDFDFFLDVCGCGLWWFGYEWGLSAGGFQSICCCFCNVFMSYFTWDCTGDYLRLYLRCLWYLRETILEILLGFLCEIMYLSIYLYVYIYIACEFTWDYQCVAAGYVIGLFMFCFCLGFGKTLPSNKGKFYLLAMIKLYNMLFVDILYVFYL